MAPRQFVACQFRFLFSLCEHRTAVHGMRIFRFRRINENNNNNPWTVDVDRRHEPHSVNADCDCF